MTRMHAAQIARWTSSTGRSSITIPSLLNDSDNTEPQSIKFWPYESLQEAQSRQFPYRPRQCLSVQPATSYSPAYNYQSASVLSSPETAVSTPMLDVSTPITCVSAKKARHTIPNATRRPSRPAYTVEHKIFVWYHRVDLRMSWPSIMREFSYFFPHRSTARLQ